MPRRPERGLEGGPGGRTRPAPPAPAFPPAVCLSASKRRCSRSTTVSRSKRADRVESVLRHVDATLARALTRARTRGAGVLRKQISGVQTGLKKLSGGLEQLEAKPPAASPNRGDRPATASKPARARKPEKAA